MIVESSKNREIVEAALSGVVDARRTYAAWTRNGGYFSWAPEYLLTVSVAQAIWEWCSPMTVWPEYGVQDALREALPDIDDLPARMGGGRRVDLLLYRQAPLPCAVIEIKRNVEGWGKVAGDVERLRTMLAAPGSSFELGIVAFSCTQVAGRGAEGGRGAIMVKDRLSRMADSAEDVILPGWRCGLTARGVNFDGHEHWSAAAVVLEKIAPKKPLRSGDRSCAERSAQVPSPS